MGNSGSKTTGPHPYGYVADDAPVPPGFGKVHRALCARDGPLKTFQYDDGTTTLTLYDNFQRGLRINPSGNCMGWRPITDGQAQPFTWITYRQAWERIRNFGSGLHHLNLFPVVHCEGEPSMRMIGVYSKNRIEWVIAEQACNAYSGVVVPLYDTLGPDTIAYVVNQAQLCTVICGTAKEVKALLGVKDKCPTLQHIVTMEPVAGVAPVDGVTLQAFTEVEGVGAANSLEPIPPAADDVASFCYTSGTTGDPKGAMLSHAAIIADVAAAQYAGVQMRPDDVHLSYLPLPHMFERVVQCALWADGGSIGFYQGDAQKITDDLKELRPTVFPSVPRLFNKIYDKIIAGVNEAGGLKAKAFGKARESKTAHLQDGAVKHRIWDKVVFGPLQQRLGFDRCRVMLTGSAPIAQHVIQFLRIAFSCAVCEGYGQTECAAAATITDLDDQGSVGHVGGPLACNEIALCDVPDMGYLATDDMHGDQPVRGRGEVCFRGHNLFIGYYRNQEKTNEALVDGWLHSGDIGVWLPNGALKIVDRKKNFFKLAQGEYVAAEKIENTYLKSSFIEQIFIYGDSLHSYLLAIIVPDLDGINTWNAEQGGAAGGQERVGREAMCSNPAFVTAVVNDMKAVAREAGLHSFEQAKEIFLTPEPFTVENNLLTPTFKLKRKEAQEAFQSNIDKMYEKEQIGGQAGLRQGQ